MGILDDIGDAFAGKPFTIEEPDTDADGLGDQNDLDDDGDGVPDVQERQRGSDPLLADTDGDGLDDRRESLHGGDPLRVDTDGDLLTDAEEVDVYGTDPGAVDSDGDGWRDGYEVLESGTDPARADTDGDGLADRAEANHGTSPFDRDTDGDGLSDGDEVLRFGTDPNHFDQAQPFGALDHHPTVRDGVLDATAAPGEVGPGFETSALPQPSPAAFVAQVEAEGDLMFGVGGAAKGYEGGGRYRPADPVGDAPGEAPTTVEGRAADAGHAVPFDAGTTVDPAGTGGATGDLPVEMDDVVAEPEPFEAAPEFGAPSDDIGLMDAAMAPEDDAPEWVDVLPEPEPEPGLDPDGADGAFEGPPDALLDLDAGGPVAFDDGVDEAFAVDG